MDATATTHPYSLTYAVSLYRAHYSLPYRDILHKALKAMQECPSSALPASSHASTSETYFFGVDWTALGKEMTNLSMFGSLYKVGQVFYAIATQLKNLLAVSSPGKKIGTMESLMPGALKIATSFLTKSKELEQEIINRQVRLHQMKIKYLVASKKLPFTLASCQKVFQETYHPANSEYRSLCEKSFKEIYTPFLQNKLYHYNLFMFSYIEKISKFIPIFQFFFNKEEEIKTIEQKGQISTQFSDVNFLQLTGSEMIDLFKEKLGLPYTFILEEETRQYKEKLHDYQHLTLDDEQGFYRFCFTNAKASSGKVYSETRKTLE